jgi:predicted nucleic acid-binding Zn ribbon protein
VSEHSIEPVFFCRVCSKQVPLARKSRIYCSGSCRELRKQVKKHRRANTLSKAAGDALREALIPIEQLPASAQTLIKAKKVPVLYQDRTVYPRALDREMAELYAQQIYEKSHAWDIPVNVNKTALGRILTNKQVFNYCGTITWNQNQFKKSNAYNRILWLKYQTEEDFE